ncbi:MAG TPA: transcription antitermination factor NusB [bacterium]|nr:transcription antitermination factor NusB [bacterium]
MSRNKARLVAMQALFQLDDAADAVDMVIKVRGEEEQLTERDYMYLDELKKSVALNRKAIDDYISEYSIDWDLNRLGKVERAILRIAVCEALYFPDIPVSVSINEAVLLAKKYGADQSSKFINGILGRFSREVVGEKHTASAPDEDENNDGSEDSE